VVALPAGTSADQPWNFTIKINVPQDMVNEYGSLAAVEQDVNGQLATVSGRFSGSSEPVNFTANEFHVYTDDPNAELTTAHPNSNFQVVYTEAGALSGGWYGNYQSILLDWPAASGGAFAPYATDGLTHEFGHSRGAIDEYRESVTPADNPVSGQGYNAPVSIMTYPYNVTTWDPYSQGIINASGGNVYQDAPVVDGAFPKMRVKVVNAAGKVVSGSTVTLYPVSWDSAAVQTTPAARGTTGRYGYFALSTNPFQPGVANQPWNLSAPNFVVKATKNGHTGYGWLPITEVGAWYFQHPGQVYTLTIHQQ
jgi:hypothetical protein